MTTEATIPLAMAKKAVTFALNHYIKGGSIGLDEEHIYFYAPDGELIAWVRRDATNGKAKDKQWIKER